MKTIMNVLKVQNRTEKLWSRFLPTMCGYSSVALSMCWCGESRTWRTFVESVLLFSALFLWFPPLIISLRFSVHCEMFSRHLDPPSLPGSSRPASVRRSSTSWTPTCLARTPRARRAFRPTGKTSTSSRRTAWPACQIQPSATTRPSPVWD